MKTKYAIIIIGLLVLSSLVSGCATGLTPSSWASLTVDASNAYLAGGSYVYAVNLQAGTLAWQYPAKAAAGRLFYATPVLTPDGQLIVGGFDHVLYSLNPKTGGENWQFKDARDRWYGGVLATSDTIYAPNADYNLYAIKPADGTLKWAFPADQSIWGSPVTDGTNVYFGTLGRQFYAVDAQTGKKVWMQKLNGAILGTPVMGNDQTLYVGTYGGILYALNTTDGKTLWSQKASSFIWSGPALDGKDIFIGDADGNLYSYPISGGAPSWVQKLNGTIIGTPLVIGNTIIVGTEIVGAKSGNIYFVDRNGANARPIPINGQIYATPVAAGTLILVAPTGDQTQPLLVALDESGAQKWVFTTSK